MVRTYFGQVENTLSRMPTRLIEEVVNVLEVVRKNDGIVYTLGNGGSAATASHFANDLTKMGDVRAICISDMNPTMLAYGNDNGWHNMFSGIVKAMLRPYDLVWAISCSGSSKNVIKAVLPPKTKERTWATVGLTGNKGSWLAKLSDICIKVPHSDIRVQEDVHLVICHAIAGELYERRRKKYSIS